MIQRKLRKMKINKLQILLFFISAILSFSSVAQQNENTETFLGIGSGNRKIAKIQKTPIFPIHTDSVTILDDVKYYLEPKRYMTNYSIDNIIIEKRLIHNIDKQNGNYAIHNMTNLQAFYYR